MTWSPRFQVAADATAVAMQAMVNDLDAISVDDLVTKAGQLLESDDPVFRAVVEFATQHELVRRQPEMLRNAGEVLRDRMILLMRPDPPDLDRVDIHG